MLILNDLILCYTPVIYAGIESISLRLPPEATQRVYNHASLQN
mgnify:CR=1 FL=1